MNIKLFLDKAWSNWSWISFLPMLITTLIRVATEKKQDEKSIKTHFLDDVFRIFLYPGLFYYSADLVMNWVYWKDTCSTGYIFHHVVTLAGAHSILTLDYFPGFMMVAFTSHNLLLMLPHIEIFKYCYLSCFLVCYFKFCQRPWRNIWKYQWNFGVSLCLLCGPIFTLWMLGCSNAINE